MPPSRLLRQGNPETGIGGKNLVILVGTISREYVSTYIYIHYIYLAPNMGQANSSCLRKARFFLKNESLAI